MTNLTVICDIETDGLENPQNVWCVVCREVEEDSSGVPIITATRIFHPYRSLADKHSFQFYARSVSLWIGHNFLTFDAPVLNRLCGTRIQSSSIFDTLVGSRLHDFNFQGGSHSLESWGNYLGFSKNLYENFSEWSQELENRCITDTDINFLIYKALSHLRGTLGYRLEHSSAILCQKIKDNGFYFDIEGAKKLYKQTEIEYNILIDEVRSELKPKVKALKVIVPKRTKSGSLSKIHFKWLEDPDDIEQFSEGAGFTLVDYEEFNVRSPKQCVERLNSFGWKPTDKTKTHIEWDKKYYDPQQAEKLAYFSEYGWKVNETNLNTLPADAPEAAHKLAEGLLLGSRLSTINSWIEAFYGSPREDNRLHPTLLHIGAWTHRKSHSNPNCANIPRLLKDDGTPTLLGREMRSLWTVPEGRRLIGVDADGIQMRIFAHYVNSPVLINSILSGDKTKGTDIHSTNQKALGDICRDRNAAKTFIYAWLLGAGFKKVSDILGCTVAQARVACENFIKAYPGLQELKESVIPSDARRGYFIGLDGRKVYQDSEHLMLAGYLQNGESVIMKYANMLWDKRLTDEGIPFWQVNDVHDEWQTETIDKDDVVNYIIDVQCWALEQAGRLLNLNIPIEGSGSFGYNWAETH